MLARAAATGTHGAEMAVAGKFNIQVESLKQSRISARLRSGAAEPVTDQLGSDSATDAEPPNGSDGEA